jgi:plastocyanin
MADRDKQDVGPRLVWTFPLATRVQSRTRVFNIGDNVLSMINSIGESNDEVSEDPKETHGGTEDLERELNEVIETGDDVFNELDSELNDGTDFSQSGTETEVVIEGMVAIPTVVNINKGDTVTWVNKDDTTRRIRSVQGEEFDSGQLEQGDTYSYTFDSDGAIVYVDTIAGGSELSGAVVVGDAESPESLPSETELEAVPFGGESVSGSPKSMSDAAEDADNIEANMGTGFN